MARRGDIVIDGANVAFEERSADGKPKVSNLVAIARQVRDRGYEPIIIIDASLRHEVDDPRQLEALIDDQRVRQVPAGTDADFFVLKTAEQQRAPVVSNDQFKPHREQFPWIEQRRVPFMIVEGRVQLYEQALERVERSG